MEMTVDIISGVITNGNGITAYPQEKRETDCLLKECGWKPVNARKLKSKLARRIFKRYIDVQVYYNSATKAKYAFLGHHAYKDGQVLWLRIIGDTEPWR